MTITRSIIFYGNTICDMDVNNIDCHLRFQGSWEILYELDIFDFILCMKMLE